MTDNTRMRGEIPFPEAGEGIVLRFRNPDCDLLQKKFGDSWFLDALPKCNRFDMEFLRECVKVGAKKDGKKAEIDFDSLDIPLSTISEHVIDALFLAMHGRTFNDQLTFLDNMKHLNAKESEGNESSPENT